MTAWLLRTIGIGGELTQQVDDLDWLASRPIWLWVAVVGAPVLWWLIASRHRASLSHIRPWARHTLTACRVGFFVLLMVVLAGPYLRLHQQITSKPVLAFVIDESASMALGAGPWDTARIESMAKLLQWSPPGEGEGPAAQRKRLNDMSRTALLQEALRAQHESLIQPLEDRFEVRHYRVASEVRQVEVTRAPESIRPDAAQDTALGAALRQAIDDAAGQPIAGIALFTDGRTTAGIDPMSVVRQAVAGGATSAPVWAVPVGSDISPGADVAVTDVLAPQRVSIKDTIHVIATISAVGLGGRQVTVRLKEGDTMIDEAALVLDDRPSQQVTLTCDAPEAGVRLLTVDIEPQSEEEVKSNNVAAVSIEVDTRKCKVLYLEGYPRWDFRFLDHELRRDHGLEVTLVMESALIDAGVKPQELPTVAKLPEDAEGWGQYDVVVIGDVSPVLLTDRVQDQLAKAVEEEGVGLLVQAGFAHMPHAYASGETGSLLRLLPVKPDGMTDAGGLDAPPFSPFRMVVTAGGSIHPALRLYPGAERNRAVWSQMPAFYWAAATGEATAAATVLGEFEHEGRMRPLIVEHWAGRGRVMFVGLDSTYRWRRNIGSTLFGRFWNQAIRHVARSDDRRDDQTLLLATPARVEANEPVKVELFLADDERERLDASEAEVSIVGPDDRTDRVILRSAGDTGRFTGLWRPTTQGRYTLTYQGSGESATASVAVASSGRELVQPSIDRPGLRAIASASGGAMIELDRLDELPQRLKGEPSTVARVVEDEVWDNWLTLVLLAGLYCLDVGIRRLHGLT